MLPPAPAAGPGQRLSLCDGEATGVVVELRAIPDCADLATGVVAGGHVPHLRVLGAMAAHGPERGPHRRRPARARLDVLPVPVAERDDLRVAGLQLVPEGDHRALLRLGGPLPREPRHLDADDEHVRARVRPVPAAGGPRVARAVVATRIISVADGPGIDGPRDAVLRQAAHHLAVLPAIGGLLDRVVDGHAPSRVAAQVLGDVPALGHVPGDRQRRPPAARAVVMGSWVGDGLAGVARHGPFTRGRSTESRPAAVSRSGTRTGGRTS